MNESASTAECAAGFLVLVCAFRFALTSHKRETHTMNLILRYIKVIDTWLIYERGPLGAYWIIAMHDTREGAVKMLERIVL
jgi:hypothetical protein